MNTFTVALLALAVPALGASPSGAPSGTPAPPPATAAPLTAPATAPRVDAPPARPVTILVLPLDARQGVTGDTADFTTSLLVARMRELPGFKVLAYRELEAMMALEVKKMLQGCDEVSCAAEMAGALNADQVVVGSVGRLGSTMVLTVSRVRQRDASVMGSWADQFEAPNDGVVGKQIPVAVKALFPEVFGPPVTAAGPAAQAPVGQAPLAGNNAPAAPAGAPAAATGAPPSEPGMRVLATVLKGAGGVVAGLSAVAALGGLVAIGVGAFIIGLYVRGLYDYSAEPVPVSFVQGGTLAAVLGVAVAAVAAVLLVMGVVAVAGGVVLD